GIGRLGRGNKRYGRYHNSAGFGLPPGIYYGAFFLSYIVVIPVPGLFVYRFAYRTQHFKGRQIVLFYDFSALLCQCPDGCRCGIKLVYPVLFYNVPEASKIGIMGYAFKKNTGSTVAQRTVDNITVTGNPANISGTPINIGFAILKYILKGIGGIYHIACRGMHHDFRLSGRAGSVQDKQRVFGIHGFSFAFVVGSLKQGLQPLVATFLHFYFTVNAFGHQYGFYSGTALQGFVYNAFEVYGFFAPVRP